MGKLSKRFQRAIEKTDLSKGYSIEEAVEALKLLDPVKFDETIELSVCLGVDPKHSDQMVRGVVKLPHGSGKKVSVAVFTENPEVALEAGADHAGLEELLEKVQGGWLGFDVAIATTSAMKKVRTVARILGPRGLMPNPKSGTVTDEVAGAIQEVKAGRVEFKMDKTACVAIVVGKRSFSTVHLEENIRAAIDALLRARPESFKGRLVKSLTISATMSPGVKLEEKIFASL